MNIIYIDHYAGSSSYGRSFRPYYLGKEWIKKGHKVFVIGGSFSHLRYKQPDVIRENIEGIEYIWLKTPRYKGNGLKRVFSMMAFFFQLLINLRHIIKTTKPDVVIGSTVYMLDMIPAWIIKKTRKIKLIFELHDVWPASPKELGNYSKFHPFIILISLSEWLAYKLCDKVISMLPNTFQHMKKFGIEKNNFLHIPNGVDLEEYKKSPALPVEITSTLKNIKANNKTIICYTGQHGLSNNLSILLEAAEFLKKEDIHFLFVGDGPEKEALKTIAKKFKIKEITFLDKINKSLIPVLLAEVDILYIGWKKSALYGFGISANKIFDYMMSKKPIIHGVEAANDPIKESGCGISIPPENKDELVIAIKKMIFLPKEEKEIMGKKGYDYVCKHHDYKLLADKFLKEFHKGIMKFY